MAVFTAIAIASLAVSAYGAYKASKAAKDAGKAQQSAANSQADLAEYNAGIADVQATDATARGAEDESRFRMGVRGMIGAQRAGIAAGNIDVGYGSAVDVQADAAFLGELDALTVRTNAAREAWGYKVGAEDLRRRAAISRKEGVNLAATGDANAATIRVQAGATLLTGAGNLMQARYGK